MRVQVFFKRQRPCWPSQSDAGGVSFHGAGCACVRKKVSTLHTHARDSAAIRPRFDAIRMTSSRFGFFSKVFAWVSLMTVRDSSVPTHPLYPPPCLRGTFGVFGSPSRFMTCHFMTLPHLIHSLTPFNYNFFTIKGAHNVFTRRCGGLPRGSRVAPT